MARKNKDTLKTYFQTGDYPTEQQFSDAIDSSLGVLDSTDALPAASAENFGAEYKIGNVYYKCTQTGGVYSWTATGTAVQTNQYSDLEGKPSIGGVRIAGDIDDVDTLGALSKDTGVYEDAGSEISGDAVVYINQGDNWVKTTLETLVQALGLTTSEALDGFKEEVLAEADSLVESALDSKMDKNLEGVEEVSYLGDEGFVPVVVDGELVKMTVMNMADYMSVKKESAKSSMGTGVASQRKYIALEGEQDGSNVDYITETGFVLGTTALYLNGQLMTNGYDYTEISSYQIKMLSHIPLSTDILILMAIPLAE